MLTTSVTANLIHVFIARLYTVWRVIIACHYCEYRFSHAVNAREAFYSRAGLQVCLGVRIL